MNAANSTTRVVSDSGSDVGPGERLREAREAARLSVGEVASRLRLTPGVVERLEADDYERLHGATFVRGYLSSYARLLDLPEGPILEAYERHGQGPPALVSELGHKAEVHVSDFPVRMVTYVIAGLLVVLVVLWWQSRQLGTNADTASSSLAESAAPAATDGGASTHRPPAMDTDSGMSAPAQSPAPAAEAENDIGTSTSSQLPSAQTQEPPETVASAPQASPARGEAPVGDAHEQSEAAAANDAGAPAAQAPIQPSGEAGQAHNTEQLPAAALDSTGASGGEQVADAALPTTLENDGDAGPEATPPPPPPLPGSDVLAIQLARESWIEIYDRGGGRLYYSLAREGSEVVVQGAGPMRVLLGEVEGAIVAYNGEPYDLSRYRGRSVVRFTVGELSGQSTQETPAPSAAGEPLTRELQQPPGQEQGHSVVDAGDAITTLVEQAATSSAESTPESALRAPAVTSRPASGISGEQPDS